MFASPPARRAASVRPSPGLRRALGRALRIACVLTALPALGYVLPAYSILRRYVDRRDDLHLSALRVTGAATFFGPAVEGAASALDSAAEGSFQVPAVFSMKAPGRCRLELTSPEGGKAAIVHSHGKRRVEGAEIPAAAEALTQLCALLGFRAGAAGEARAGLERHLRGLGVEGRGTSLARLDGKVAYVIGSQEPDAAQLWIYKDRFEPARVRHGKGGSTWDVRLLGFGSPVAGDWFPRAVEVYQGDALALRLTVHEANPRPSLPDSLF